MKKLLFGMTFVIVALIGCTAGVVLHDSFTPEALAQAPAPVHQYTACIRVSIAAAHSSRDINAGEAPQQDKMLKVPDGWTPIGGAGNTIIMCR